MTFTRSCRGSPSLSSTPYRLSVRMQVTRVVFQVGVKAMLDGTLGRQAARERDKDRILGELIRAFESEEHRART
jgi:hypothetical protein